MIIKILITSLLIGPQICNGMEAKRIETKKNLLKKLHERKAEKKEVAKQKLEKLTQEIKRAEENYAKIENEIQKKQAAAKKEINEITQQIDLKGYEYERKIDDVVAALKKITKDFHEEYRQILQLEQKFIKICKNDDTAMGQNYIIKAKANFITTLFKLTDSPTMLNKRDDIETLYKSLTQTLESNAWSTSKRSEERLELSNSLVDSGIVDDQKNELVQSRILQKEFAQIFDTTVSFDFLLHFAEGKLNTEKSPAQLNTISADTLSIERLLISETEIQIPKPWSGVSYTIFVPKDSIENNQKKLKNLPQILFDYHERVLPFISDDQKIAYDSFEKEHLQLSKQAISWALLYKCFPIEFDRFLTDPIKSVSEKILTSGKKALCISLPGIMHIWKTGIEIPVHFEWGFDKNSLSKKSPLCYHRSAAIHQSKKTS